MAKQKGLGRGLDSIFLDNTEETATGVSMMRLSDIGPRTDQPRKNFDTEALSALAESISEHGLIEPIIVRAADGGFYEIIAGERRWRAAKMAGLSEIPAIVSDFDDRKTAEIALIENIQREDLNPVEEAMGYRALMDEYGLTQEEVAKRIGKSRPAIANTLRLLDLPREVTDLVSRGTISQGHARTLLGLANKSLAIQAAEAVVKKDLSVRDTEELVRKLNRGRTGAKTPSGDGVDYIARLEKKARKLLGRKVVIRNGKAKRVELTFEDDEDLEALLTKLCGKDVFDN